MKILLTVLAVLAAWGGIGTALGILVGKMIALGERRYHRPDSAGPAPSPPTPRPLPPPPRPGERCSNIDCARCWTRP